MRKNLFVFIVACLSLFSSFTVAQNVVRAYADTKISGAVNGVSENGEWAAGSDGGIITYAAFVWNKETGMFKDVFGLLEDGSMGNSGTNCSAFLYDISNDGIAVGNFADGRASINGNPAVIPGFYDAKTNKWTVLPGFEGVAITGGETNGCATKISPDGKIIAGYLPLSNGVVVPVLWIDGQPKRVDNLEYEGQGGFVTDMTDDGKVLAGFAEWYDGSRYPAVFKDGKCIRLIGTEPAMSDPEKWPDFYVGVIQSISPDGKTIGGTFAADGVNAFGFTYEIPDNIEGDELLVPEEDVVKHDFLVSHLDGNNHIFGSEDVYGPAKLIADGDVVTFEEYYGKSDYTPAVIFDGNTEGTVFASAIVQEAMGIPVNAPLVLVCGDSSSIHETESIGLVMNMNGTVLNVYGYHDSVSLYSAGGNCVYSNRSGSGVYDLSDLSKGIYIVKVTNDLGIESVKIVL